MSDAEFLNQVAVYRTTCARRMVAGIFFAGLLGFLGLVAVIDLFRPWSSQFDGLQDVVLMLLACVASPAFFVGSLKELVDYAQAKDRVRDMSAFARAEANSLV